MQLKQQAGGIAMVAWTDGHPVRTEIRLIDAVDNETSTCRLSYEDLHDLQYCVARMLTKLEAQGVHDG